MASNGQQRLYIPHSTMPSAEVVAKTMVNDADDGAGADTCYDYLKFGFDVGGGNIYYRGIITIKLPLLEDVFGDVTTGLYNSDTPVGDIENIAIRLDPGNQLTNIGKYHVYKIKKRYTQYAAGINETVSTGGGHSANHVQTDYTTWNSYAVSEMSKDTDVDNDGQVYWDTPGAFVKGIAAQGTNGSKIPTGSGNADLDQTTDYGHGANGIIHMFNVENHGSDNTITIPLKPLLDADSFTWGDTFRLLIKHEGAVDKGFGTSGEDAEWGDEAHRNAQTNIGCDASTFGGTVSSSLVQVEIIYQDAPPTKPIIKLSADPTDFRTPIVTFSTFPSDADLQNVALHFNTSNAFTFDASPGSEVKTVLSTFNGESYRDLENTTFLNTAGTKNYFLTAIASDNTSYVQGNVINKGRMQCSGAIASTTSIGTQVTLTVTGSNGDYSGKFAKVGVNWNSGASDNISDYRIVTLAEEATSTTITHTYDTSDVFQVKLFTVDRDGFRSGKTNAANTTTVKPIGTTDRAAVAKLSVSRDTAVRARYGDSFSVITLSGAQGYAVGSDKRVGTYLFKHNNSSDANPLTTNPLGNNNDSFNAVSQIVKLRCNQAGRDGTSLKVWGWCSVEADGTPIADNSANFDHYEWQVHSISPHASANTVGTQAQTGGEDVYYKSVEFVALDAIDADDNGTATSAGTVNRYVLVDGAGNIINSEIRGTADDYSFGGYITSGDITVAFHDTNKTITRSSGSFLTDGFEVGDVVMIGGSLEDSVNNIFTKITALTATIMTVEDDLEDGDGSNANVKILKAQGPTLQVASYDETAPTFTHKIVPININQSSAVNDIEKGGADATNNAPVSTEVTQQVTFESEEYHTYDFDTEADARNISITNAVLNRRGGITGVMPLGQGRYPISPTRTSLGLPTMAISVRAHTQTGYRKLWNLIQGDRYEWSTIDSKKVDSPDNSFRQLRLKIIDGTLNKDPSLANEYTATLNFLVIGELVT
jgi:hypothetical protein